MVVGVAFDLDVDVLLKIEALKGDIWKDGDFHLVLFR